MTSVRNLWQDRRGVAAVEFAIFVQIIALLFAGTFDIGAVIYKRFLLDNALNAAANYAMTNAANVTSSTGVALASTLGNITVNTVGPNYANAVVVVNNGPTRTVTGGTGADSGTAANADACYCPTLSAGAGSALVWGSATTCASPCASGLRAGKFVTLTASKAHTPLFANYGIVHAGTITVSTTVQVG